MEVFVGVIFYSIAFHNIFSVYKNKYLEKYIFYIAIIYLICISGFRDVTIGTDKMSYYGYFMRNLEYGEIAEYYHYQGILFWHIFYWVKDIFYEYQIILVITSFISITLIGMYIWKLSKYKFLSLLIYTTCGFYAIGMSMLRQYIAISILTYATIYIRERNLRKFIICFVLAMLIHASSILFLPAYFIGYIKMNKKNIFIYIVITIIICILTKIIINTISNIFFGGGYEFFIGEEGGGKVTFVGYVLILLISLLLKKRILLDNKNLIFYNLLWIAIIIQSTAFIFPIASRAAYLYSMTLIVFIPEIIYIIRDIKWKYISISFLIGICLFIYFYKFYNLNNVYPYKFFFE